MDRLLQDKTLNDDARTCAAKQLSDLGIPSQMTVEAIEFQTLELDAVIASCKQLKANYTGIIKDLPSQLQAYFQDTAISRSQLAVLLALIESAPQALWSLRDDSFHCYEMDFRLAELQQQLAILKPLNKKLTPFVNTNTLGSAHTLYSIQCCLDNAGMFRWFSTQWRKAKQQALSFAVNDQLKLEDIKMLFPAMIKYVNTQDRFDVLLAQAPVLATCDKGLNTDVTPLLAVREWYKDVAFAAAEHFHGDVGLLDGLSVIDKSSAEQLAGEYQTSLRTLINNVDKKVNKVKLSFPKYTVLQQADTSYSSSVVELKTLVVNALTVLKEGGADNNTSLSELLKDRGLNA